MADPVVAIKLTGAWNSFQKVIDPKHFEARLHAEVRRANDRIGRQAVARVRRAIRAGAYAPNSPITIILKGSSKPLVNRGDLVQSITYSQPTWNEVDVGVHRVREGDQVVNVAAILHEGATIDVKKHPKVRAKVWAMVRDALGPGRRLNKLQKASVGQAQAALGLASPKGKRKLTRKQLALLWAKQPKTPGTGKDVWVIPARPFIREPLTDGAFRKWVLEQWNAAVKIAMTGKAA